MLKLLNSCNLSRNKNMLNFWYLTPNMISISDYIFPSIYSVKGIFHECKYVPPLYVNQIEIKLQPADWTKVTKNELGYFSWSLILYTATFLWVDTERNYTSLESLISWNTRCIDFKLGQELVETRLACLLDSKAAPFG